MIDRAHSTDFLYNTYFLQDCWWMPIHMCTKNTSSTVSQTTYPEISLPPFRPAIKMIYAEPENDSSRLSLNSSLALLLPEGECIFFAENATKKAQDYR
jgi:hypothetical protein